MRDPELEMQVDELCNQNTNRTPTEEELYDIYLWIDSLDFSRPKRCIARDFSDGVLMAELVGTYLPRSVDLKNFYSALSKKNKVNNWEHLNAKVFSKMGYKIDKQTVNDIMESKPGAIEQVLFDLRPFLARRNRSILNYRAGMKPEGPDCAPTKPKIPTATTLATECKRRARSMAPQSHRENSFIMKPKEKVNKSLLPIKQNSLKKVADSTGVTSQVGLEDKHSLVAKSLQKDFENGKRIVEQNPEGEGASLLMTSDSDCWSPSPPNSSTQDRFAAFGEELLLGGKMSKQCHKRDSQKLVKGIPGVTLGFYGLV